MTALQIELSWSSIAVSIEVFAFMRVTSGNAPTLNAREVVAPRRVIKRASCTPAGVSFATVTTNLFASGFPLASSFGFAVIPGCEK